jgi:hypothetical protein
MFGIYLLIGILIVFVTLIIARLVNDKRKILKLTKKNE